jgi:aminoglycoside phosphotransferase (APT) family kinase protein
MKGVEYGIFNGFPAIVKRYSYTETKRFKCFGSGSQNEAFLPSPIADWTPSLLAYSSSTDEEMATLEYREGQHLKGEEIGYAEAEEIGRVLGQIHSIQGNLFGSLDGSYQFRSLKEAFVPRWQVAVDLLSSLDESLARKVDKQGRLYFQYLDTWPLPRLVHGDFGLANILWSPSRHISSVLDWEHARFGDPREDWAKIRLASRFPEPNGLGSDLDLLAVVLQGWKQSVGTCDFVVDPAVHLYEIYYAVSLGVFFFPKDRQRLQWLAAHIGG